MIDKETIKIYSVGAIVFVALSLLYLGTFRTANALERSDVPIVNDAWYDALQAIKTDSENNSGHPWEKGIITSWWDFGHHFKYFSDRAVTFDGGTQVTPQAHWVGELFLSSDEDKSRNILKMLDCGGNAAFDKLSKVFDASASTDVLEYYLSTGNTDVANNESILPYLTCTPTSGYVIASEDMVGKAGVWGHFGLWDFNRADMWINVKKMQKDQGVKYMVAHSYTKDENEAQQLWTQLQTMTEPEANNWLAPWPGYAGVNDCQNQNNSMICNNGVVIAGNDVITSDGSRPQSLVYVEGGIIKERKYDDATLSYSMVLTPDNKLVSASPVLANSLFTKLFFLKGVGLKHFQLLTVTQNIDGFRIYVYKVKW